MQTLSAAVNPLRRLTSLISVILLLLVVLSGGVGRIAIAQDVIAGYEITQVTDYPIDHKWPSINRNGDIVWSIKDGFGYWQVIKQPAGGGAPQLITSGAKNHERPVIADDGTIAWFEYVSGDLLSNKVIKRSPLGIETTAEFSSFDRFSGARRTAGQYFGMTGSGNILTSYLFTDRFGSTVRRFAYNGAILTDAGGSRIDFLQNGGPYDYPDINDNGALTYARLVSRELFSSDRVDPFGPSRRDIADGNYLRISDNSVLAGGLPFFVYIDPSDKLVIDSGAGSNCGSETVESVKWADVAIDGAGSPLVAYEKAVGSYSQIFLARQGGTGPNGDNDRDCISNSVDRMLLGSTSATVRDSDDNGILRDIPSLSFSDGNTSGHIFDRFWFVGGREPYRQSAVNQGPRTSDIDAIAMHFCAAPFATCRNWLSTGSPVVSAHYVVSGSGHIVKLVNDDRKAIHATYYNSRSIGIEPEGWGRPIDWTPRMRESLVSLVAKLLHHHPNIEAQVAGGPLHPPESAQTTPSYECLNKPGIVGHQQIQPIAGTPGCRVGIGPVTDKYDPGPNFGWPDWARFVSRVLARKASLRDAPTVVVTDAEDPLDGVRIRATGGTPPLGMARVVPQCATGAATASIPLTEDVLRLRGGEDVTMSCGSMRYQVNSGPVEIELGEDILVTVPTNGYIRLSKPTTSDVRIDNLPASSATVTITDGTGTSLVSPGLSSVVAVRAINNPPVVRTGRDQSARIGAVVTLDGSSSFDPDGQAITYAWQQVSGPPAGLIAADTSTPRFIAREKGIYAFDLRVGDGIDESVSRVLVAVETAPATVNGSGIIHPNSNLYHAIFSLGVTGPIDPRGTLKFYDSQSRVNFASTTLNSLSGAGKRVYLTGRGTFNRIPNYYFDAIVQQEDRLVGSASGMALSIADQAGRVVYELPFNPIMSGTISITGEVDSLPPPAETE